MPLNTTDASPSTVPVPGRGSSGEASAASITFVQATEDGSGRGEVDRFLYGPAAGGGRGAWTPQGAKPVTPIVPLGPRTPPGLGPRTPLGLGHEVTTRTGPEASPPTIRKRENGDTFEVMMRPDRVSGDSVGMINLEIPVEASKRARIVKATIKISIEDAKNPWDNNTPRAMFGAALDPSPETPDNMKGNSNSCPDVTPQAGTSLSVGPEGEGTPQGTRASPLSAGPEGEGSSQGTGPGTPGPPIGLPHSWEVISTTGTTTSGPIVMGDEDSQQRNEDSQIRDGA